MFKNTLLTTLFTLALAVQFVPTRPQEIALVNQSMQMVSEKLNDITDAFDQLSASDKNFVLNVLAFRLEPHSVDVEQGEKITQNLLSLIEKNTEATHFFDIVFEQIDRAALPYIEFLKNSFEREKDQIEKEAMYQLIAYYNQKLIELNQICLSLVYEKLYAFSAEQDITLLLEAINEEAELITDKQGKTKQLPTLQEIAEQINQFIAAQQQLLASK